MLEAKKLRLGNVISGAGGLIDTVFEIVDNTSRGVYNQVGYEHLILVSHCGNQYKPIEIEGVILDIDWMIKCGFKEEINYSMDNHMWSITIHDGSDSPYDFIVYSKDNIEFFITYTFAGRVFTKKLKYVYNLQNTFFNFTERELEINHKW